MNVHFSVRLIAPAGLLALATAIAGAGCSGQNGGPAFTPTGDDASNGGGSTGSSSSSAGSSGAGTSSSSSGTASGGPASSSGGSSSSGSGGQGSSSGVSSSGSSGAGSSSGASGSSGSGSSSGSSSSSSGASDSGPDVSISGDASADALSFQEYDLMIINMYRAGGGLPALTLDSQLSAFALAGSQQLTQDHSPHAHFIAAGNSIFSMGFNTQAGENQGDPNGWRVLSASDPVANEEMQISQILAMMFAEGPAGDAGQHGHYLNIMSTSFTRVGVGLIEVSGKLYLTNDFSN